MYKNVSHFVKNSEGKWDNESHPAIFNSPYYKYLINNCTFISLAFLTTYHIHSSIFVTANIDESFTIETIEKINDIKIYYYGKPEELFSYKVNNNQLLITIKAFGTATIFINDDYEKPLTIFIKEEYKYLDNNYIVIDSKNNNDLGHLIINEGQQYLFKKGTYYFDTIKIDGSNTSLLFEDGTILIAKEPNDEEKYLEIDWANRKRYQPLFSNRPNINNVSIKGNALLDLSALPFHSRDTFSLQDIAHLTINGITTINPCCWCYFIYRCNDVVIKNTSIFGYRQNSDAFIIADSKRIEVDNCFARSGDDLFEVKTLDPNVDNQCQDICFSNCFAWPDKTRGLGIIDETKQSINNIWYKNIVVYGAAAYWQDALGSIIIYSNNSENHKISIKNIYFNNIKIYKNSFWPINISSTQNTDISNIIFTNIYYENNYPVRINNCGKGIFHNISFNNITYDLGQKMNRDTFITSHNGSSNISLEGEDIKYEM